MAEWTGKSRGGLLGHAFFVHTIKIGGVRAAYFLLSLVYPFYYWFDKKSKPNLIKFYQTVGIPASLIKRTVRTNFKLLGQCLIDRIAFLNGRSGFYSFSMDGEEHLLEIEKKGRGGLLLSAHLGNWEIAGNLLKQREINATVNILMLDAEHQKIKALLEKQSNPAMFNIIPITDDFSYLIKLKQAAARNELICMHADRFLPEAKTIRKTFFNQPIEIPAGPFELAKMLKLPVSIVYAVKTTKKHYELTATELLENCTVEELSDLYISSLEEQVKKHPEQWFNYYDYFNHATSS